MPKDARGWFEQGERQHQAGDLAGAIVSIGRTPSAPVLHPMPSRGPAARA